MKTWLAVLVVCVVVAQPCVVAAQSTVGYFIRPLCTTIPTPAENNVICWDSATQVLKYYHAGAYHDLTGAAGVVLDLTGTAHQILVSSPTGHVTLSLDNPVAELPALFYGAALQ